MRTASGPEDRFWGPFESSSDTFMGETIGKDAQRTIDRYRYDCEALRRSRGLMRMIAWVMAMQMAGGALFDTAVIVHMVFARLLCLQRSVAFDLDAAERTRIVRSKARRHEHQCAHDQHQRDHRAKACSVQTCRHAQGNIKDRLTIR
ncbi:MAG TPA: hypothetical protein DIC56_23460 [Rhizobium sp.]|nr:hypothetical protein [Rhizobium sp.]